MSERKTHKTKVSVNDFLNKVKNETRRTDAAIVLKMMKSASGKRPAMWGPSIIGFGTHKYKLASGKEAEICKIGFSPRAQALVFYLGNFTGRAILLKTLGKHKMGNGGCIYINKLADVNTDTLEQIIDCAYKLKST